MNPNKGCFQSNSVLLYCFHLSGVLIGILQRFTWGTEIIYMFLIHSNGPNSDGPKSKFLMLRPGS